MENTKVFHFGCITMLSRLKLLTTLGFGTKGKSWRANAPLELIHSDICGPMRTTSLSQHRYPTKPVRNKTPYEAWTGLKPSIRHFKVFGCVCYAYVPTEKRSKFEQKTWDWKENKVHNLSSNPPPASSHEENDDQSESPPSTPAGISNANLESSSPKSPPPKMRSLSEIYGFLMKGGEDKVYKLKKALYGLKQALRAWLQKCGYFNVSNEKLEKDDGANRAPSSTYRNLIGNLLRLTATRPDIMFATSVLSRFMQGPSQIHFGAAKRILRYLQGTLDYRLVYKP
ncbi:Retrovirus-related Pol polyprotein from transposon RE2 [Sesamum angolense]|uniref:Retrovirus-related Pol polyprotein from transposon RE2 n=1 Tax=Sesamum angolense TaxID=2727404 RepID=A0AAE2BLU5_9LAMI|nr:Retrovirus-related Pol polyprotein from transposon RE2 [Sesamum angolense]